MFIMGNWLRRTGTVWQLVNSQQTHYALVWLSKGGWKWGIATTTEQMVIEGNKPCSRSRKARRLAQKELFKIA